MEAIILAGGFGTRLQSVVSDVPKPMAPVNGKPFLEYLVNDLVEKGITRIIMAVGYKKEIIIDYFKDCFKNIPIMYSVEDTPLFTGGAIKKALTLSESENVFVVNGDTYFDIDFNELYEFHIKTKANLTIATKVMSNFDRYGTVTINNIGRIMKFCEKCYVKEGIINGGIYCIHKELLDKIALDKFSFEKDYMEQYVGIDNICGLEFKGYFIDIGIPEDYGRAIKYFM